MEPVIQYHIVQDMEGHLLYVGSGSVVDALIKEGYYVNPKDARIIDIHKEKGILNIRDGVWGFRKGMLRMKKRKPMPMYIQIPLEDRIKSMLSELIK